MIKKIISIFFSLNFMLYLVFGGLATIVDWASFAWGIYILQLNYVFSVIISFSLGSITNFSLNKYFNFKNNYKKLHYQFMLYLVIAIIGLLATILFMWLFIDKLGINQMYARIITTAIILVYNFLGHRFITFRILR